MILLDSLILHGFAMMIAACFLVFLIDLEVSVTSVLFDSWLACLQMLVVLLVNLSSWMASGCTVSARGMALAL